MTTAELVAHIESLVAVIDTAIREKAVIETCPQADAAREAVKTLRERCVIDTVTFGAPTKHHPTPPHPMVQEPEGGFLPRTGTIPAKSEV